MNRGFWGNRLAEQLKTAQMKVDGDRAMFEAELRKGVPVVVRRQEGAWKLDLSADQGTIEEQAALAAEFRAKAGIIERMAQEVSAGRYKTMLEADAELGRRLKGAGYAGSARPATKAAE